LRHNETNTTLLRSALQTKRLQKQTNPLLMWFLLLLCEETEVAFQKRSRKRKLDSEWNQHDTIA